MIVSDDLDYSYLGYNGYEKARTPHIDSIINAGVYFSNGYASAPSCAPSRAGLLTGRYQSRFGYESQTGSIPRLRIVTRSPVRAMRSRIARHLALNSEMLMDFM